MMSEMHCIAVSFIAVAIVLSQSAGELFIAPRNTESKVGDTTYINCSTDLESQEIFWYHADKYIYIGDMILDPYRGRFEIDRTASMGSHNLVIHSVEPGDAGTYICIDEDGFGAKRSAELVVLENSPDCQSNIQPDGVIGQNIFNIPLDEVQLTCTVTYHGNIRPQMEWKKVGDDSSIDYNVTFNVPSNNSVIYTLKLKGDISLDTTSYVCQTRRSTQNQYKCISEPIKILFFVGGKTIEQKVFRGDEITCIAKNNTFSCINQWYHGNNSCPLSCDATITTHLLGEYLCTLKCNVRGIDYFFEALNATVIDTTTSPQPSTSGTIAVAVVIPIIVILVVGLLIAVFVVRYKQRKYAQGLEQRLREEKQLELEVMMARAAFVNYSEQRGRNVAGDEIELLHKIKKEAALQDKAIPGVAILDGQLFIVREKMSQLEVYDCKNFIPALKLDVKELVAAVDMCCCKRNNCLYIMDKKKGTSREVMKISTAGKLLKNWLTKENAAGNLSATAEGNVIVTDNGKQMILEYSSEGELLHEIKLPDCKNASHAIKLDSNRYIVSHGTLADSLIRVCLVDKDGHVGESYGPKSGSAENQLNMPVYLAVGSNGCVIVADLFTNRVLLLDSNLLFKTILVPKYKQGFRNPRRVYLDENLGLLVVVIAAGIPAETIPVEAGDSREETEEGETSTENDDLLRKAEERKIPEADHSKIIEEDCRLLVFDIKPILEKYGF